MTQTNKQKISDSKDQNIHMSQTHSTNLTPEQIIEWLEGQRELMIEVWKKNPHLRKEYERLQKKL